MQCSGYTAKCNGPDNLSHGAPVIMKLNMWRYSDILVTESELGSAMETAQDMLFVMRILESMGLRVKKPMLLYINNQGAKDLANNWSVGGQTRHVEVRMYFLRELKEQDLIHCVWKSGLEMCSDLFTKIFQEMCSRNTPWHTAVTMST
jgi:hypothetical protein